MQNEMERRFGVTQIVRFDIVTRSMGGLGARYFLQFGPKRCWLTHPCRRLPGQDDDTPLEYQPLSHSVV